MELMFGIDMTPIDSRLMYFNKKWTRKGKAGDTEHGSFEITKESIPWILKNAITSMHNESRCYIIYYNTVFSSFDKS